MIPMPGLSAPELEALALDMQRGPYLARPSVQMLSLDHEPLDDLSDRVLDGQVDVKLEGKVSSRSLSLTVVDPRREVAIDGADASKGALFYDKLIQAGVEFKGPRLGRWVTIPLFCGPITNGSRSGFNANVTAQDKSRLATGMRWAPHTYLKSESRVETIADLLMTTGEARERIHLPGGGGRLPADIAVGRLDRAWQPVLSIAEGMTRQAFYDGRGDFRLRGWPADPKVTFTEGRHGTILTAPEVTYDQYAGFNGVWVRGKVKANGKRPSATVWLPPAHPLSPNARRRGGVPFRMAYVVESNKVRNNAEARELADLWLRRLAREVVKVTVDVMPNWLVEPGDVVAISTPKVGYIEQVLREYSLPLRPAPMSIGATKPITRPRRKVVKR